jgi:hypothetical protein
MSGYSGMSGVSGDTVAITPKSFSEDVTNTDDSGVFAWLRPLNDDAAVHAVAKYQKFEHVRQFLQAEHRPKRLGSIFTEDGDRVDEVGEEATREAKEWVGSFKFSLNHLPRHPAKGWYLGADRGGSAKEAAEVDILLAPPARIWMELGIARNHVRLSFHKELCRIVLEVRHTTFLGTKTLLSSDIHVLGHEEVIGIGNCTYVFEYTDFFRSPAFQERLVRFMTQYYGADWEMHNLISSSQRVCLKGWVNITAHLALSTKEPLGW